MSTLTIQRLVESFFRRRMLCLLPVLLLTGLGVYSVLGQHKTYRSVGSVNVASSTLITTLTGGSQGYGYDTPAGATSKQLNSLLQTDQFVADIAKRAGLDDAIKSGIVTLRTVRSGLTAWSNGPNLLIVAATSADPLAAQRLASGTIDAFVDSIVTANLGDSTAAQSFFSGLLKQYQGDVDTARNALDGWVKAHPAPGFGRTRPEDEQSTLKQLTDELTTATDRYNNALAKSDSAQLSALQAKSDVTQRLKVVDSPGLPLLPQSGKKAMALKMALFLVVGLLLGAVAVVLGAMLDRTVRFSNDVREGLHLRLLASVPDGGSLAFAPDSSTEPSRRARRHAVDHHDAVRQAS